MRWTVVIPAKSLPAAKSRLVPASVDAEGHRRLVEAIRLDTAAAAQAAAGVAHLVVVADGDPGTAHLITHLRGVVLLRQAAPGLNAALREAAAHAGRVWPADGVAALVGDLPALQPDELAQALVAAAGHARAFVPDAAGAGTTLLTARPHTPLDPAFGPGSAARHAEAATTLTAGPGLRADVDTADDLDAAAHLGLGPATDALLTAVGAARREHDPDGPPGTMPL